MNEIVNLQNHYSHYENQAMFHEISSNLSNRIKTNAKPFRAFANEIQIQNRILKSLPANLLKELLFQMDLIDIDRSEYLYQPEDIIDYLYFPETAIISDFHILEDGKTMEAAMIGREGMVGISSIFNPHASASWIQTSISGTAWRIDTKTFRQKFHNSESLQRLIFEYVNLYVAQISQKVVCNSHHSVEERLCCWLLMISDRCGLSTLPLTQEQIAGFLGVHRPSVTLITQSLRVSGVIAYLRGKISILDKVKLEFSSCDCYSAMKVM